MRFGSHVYGTNTPSSDQDFKSVFVPSARQILLQRSTKVSRNQSTGDPAKKNTPDCVDLEEFSLHGFLKLLCEGQTVAVDMLFVPPRHVIQTSDVWREIQENRGRLVSRSIAPFVGYCRAQANKYGIKGSRMAAARDAAAVFERLESIDSRSVVGDYIEEIEQLVSAHDHITIESRTHPKSQKTERHVSVCGKMAGFKLQVRHAAKMYGDLWQRYGERSRQAMNNEGIDWKALMHARRICDQAVELLATGEVFFPRPNATDLLKIRLGERPYAEVAKEIEEGMASLELAMSSSSLQPKPDRAWADDFVADQYARHIREVPKDL